MLTGGGNCFLARVRSPMITLIRPNGGSRRPSRNVRSSPPRGSGIGSSKARCQPFSAILGSSPARSPSPSGLPAFAEAALIERMNATKSREVIWGGRVSAAKLNAEAARKRAVEAVREADRAEAHAWSLRMEGFGGPAQPSPTIAQCLNGGYGQPDGPPLCTSVSPIDCQRYASSSSTAPNSKARVSGFDRPRL
jgi:hypothetical protein